MVLPLVPRKNPNQWIVPANHPSWILIPIEGKYRRQTKYFESCCLQKKFAANMDLFEPPSLFFLWGGQRLFSVFYSTLLHLPPSDSIVSEDAGTEPRTVATLAFAVPDALATRLDLIHHSARSHPHSAISHTRDSARSHTHSDRSHQHSAKSHPHSARSHPLLG